MPGARHRYACPGARWDAPVRRTSAASWSRPRVFARHSPRPRRPCASNSARKAVAMDVARQHHSQRRAAGRRRQRGEPAAIGRELLLDRAPMAARRQQPEQRREQHRLRDQQRGDGAAPAPRRARARISPEGRKHSPAPRTLLINCGSPSASTLRRRAAHMDIDDDCCSVRNYTPRRLVAASTV